MSKQLLTILGQSSLKQRVSNLFKYNPVNNLSIFTSPILIYRASTNLQIQNSIKELEELSIKPHPFAYIERMGNDDTRYSWFIKPENIDSFFKQMQSEKQSVIVDFFQARISLIIYDDHLE